LKIEKCKICGEKIELENDDQIKICYGIGHITRKQFEQKQKDERE